MTTSQQRADELLADYQAQRIEQVMEAIAKAERDVAFYERLILRLEGAVWELKKHFDDPRLTTVWFDEIEVCRALILRLEGAVWELKKHFDDPRLTTVWFDEIEVCRDVLSRLLDTAEGKLK